MQYAQRQVGFYIATFIGKTILEMNHEADSLRRILLVERLWELNLYFVPVIGARAATTAPSFLSDCSSGTGDTQA